MFVATVGLAVMQALIKELSHIHVIQIIFFRSGITAVMSTSYLLRHKISLVGNKQLLLILRTIFGIISMVTFFVTIQRIPFGASVSIKYLAPLFAIILALLFLKEKILSIQWLFFTGALIGIIMLKGFDLRIDNLSFVLAIIGALATACVYVIIRIIGPSEHPLVVVNYFMTATTLLSGVLLIFFWETPEAIEFLLLLLIGMTGYLGQKYMTASFQMEEMNVVAPIKYMEPVLAVVIGLVIYNETYELIAFLGLLLLMLCVFMNLRYQNKKIGEP